MQNKTIFSIVVFILLISCSQKNHNKNDSIIISENGIDLSQRNDEKTYFLKQKSLENIIGYYLASYDGYFNGPEYIAFITVDESNLIINKFNIINNENIYEEIIRFSLDTYNLERNIFIDGENIFMLNRYGSEIIFGISPLFEGEYVHFRRKTRFFYYISNEINEELFKYTYDSQKYFVGEYIFDSYTLCGIDEDEFTAYNNERREIEQLIINDNGMLYLDEPYRFWNFLIIDGKSTIFGNTPASGFRIQIYYLDNKIIYQIDIEWHDGELKEVEKGVFRNEEIIDKGYKIFYKNKLE